KPYIGWLVLLIAAISVQVWATLQLPNYMSHIVNDGIVGGDQNLIWQKGVQMVIITIVGGIAMVLASYLASRISTGVARDLRKNTFDKIESFSLNEINQFSTASLITRTTNDIQQIQQVLFMMLRMVLMAPIMAGGAIIEALNSAPNMTWIIALSVVILFVIIIILLIVALPKFTMLQKLIDRLNLVTRENLTGLRVIRAFNNEKYEEDKFGTANQDLMKVNLFVNRVMVIMMPLMTFIFNLTTLLIIWVGAHLIADGNLAIGNMMAFMQYAIQVIMSFLMISMVFILLPRAQVSAKRIVEVLETKLSIKPAAKPKTPKNNMHGVVEFKDVTFAYPDADTPVLKGISFKSLPGQVTAFIGSTGSGKSTLINLIPRFYDVTKGAVLVNGVDVRDLSAKVLMGKIGYIPQKGVLFSGTVKDNINYGSNKADSKQVHAAAKVAQAYNFIEKLDGKFDAHIAQGGQNVSGGQKQRLSIARAIARDPEIYIFDDSFSALDFKTDRALREALKPVTKNAATLIVAQRISTIEDADQIIVLNEGKMVGLGTHQELMKTCKVYQEIARSQLSEAEIKKSLKGKK
ncbi:ABC transporter ATP-binding protein/permease, partial [Candidatus Saccharibacteria bacterium]|nr:ABC transporter ATP-binding protein/permease [Candidatus Saccharibacteria bacterium]